MLDDAMRRTIHTHRLGQAVQSSLTEIIETDIPYHIGAIPMNLRCTATVSEIGY